MNIHKTPINKGKLRGVDIMKINGTGLCRYWQQGRKNDR